MPCCWQPKPDHPPRALEHPSAGSAPPHILPVGLHHWSYGATKDPSQFVRSSNLESSRERIKPTVDVFPFPPRTHSAIAQLLTHRGSASYVAASYRSSLGCAHRAEQDDGELIWLAAHSPIGGVIRETPRQGGGEEAEVYVVLLMPHDGRNIFSSLL